MADKKVTLEVAVETQANKIDVLESRLNKLKSEKIEADINVNSTRLDEVNSKIQSVEGELEKLESGTDIPVEVEDSEIQRLKSELDSLKDEKANLEIKVASDELKKAKLEAQSLNKTPVEIPLTTKGVEKLDKIKQTVNGLNTKTVEIPIKTTGESKLDSVQGKVIEINGRQIVIPVDTDGEEKINNVYELIEQANGKTIVVPVDVEGEEVLDEIQSKMDAIESDDITVQLNNQSAMQGLEQIADGFSRIKSSAMEVGQQFGDLLASAGKQETNFAFLKNAVGDAELARQKMQEINDIVAQLPGDDTALQGLLSSAAAKDSSLTAENLRSMANSATDYFSAMSYYGKSATEAQQDMTNYLLAGNTAELERSPILQGHIDKLKEANTVQERSKALAEALNEEHWGGMGAMDTYNNKLETFNGMLERGRYTLGGMFQEAAKGGMDFLLKLDESTNGLVGMTIAAGQLATPLAEAVIGLGQMATGINAIKETKLAEWAGTVKDKISGIGSSIKNIDFASKFNSLKTGLMGIATKAKEAAVSIGSTLKKALVGAATAAKEAVIWLARTSKELLISAANAIKSAAAWVWDNAVKAASTIATKAMAAAQWLLNAAMSANPITIIIIAIVALVAILWYLYNTCEPVRNAIDGLWAGVSGAIQPIIESVQWLIDKLTQLANGDWTVTIEIAKAGTSAGIEGIFNFANNDISRGIVSAILGPDALAQIDEQMPAFQEKLTTSFNEMLDAIWNDGTQGFLGWLWNLAGIDVGSYLSGLQSSFMSIPEWVNQAGVGAIQGFANMFAGVSSWLNSIIARVTGFAGSLVSTIRNAASSAVNGFMGYLSSLPGRVAGELNAILQHAIEWGRNLINTLVNAAKEAVSGILGAFQINSPGIIQRKLVTEFTNTNERVDNITTSMATMLGANSHSMVRAWGNPEFSYSFGGDVSLGNGGFDVMEIIRLLNDLIGAVRSSNGGNIDNTFVLNGDIDNEDRMQKFLDAVVREMEWDNKTAGRDIDKLGV